MNHGACYIYTYVMNHGTHVCVYVYIYTYVMNHDTNVSRRYLYTTWVSFIWLFSEIYVSFYMNRGISSGDVRMQPGSAYTNELHTQHMSF